MPIRVQHGNKIFEPPIKSPFVLDRLKNGASKISFTIVGQELALHGTYGGLVISEGDIVTFTSDTIRPYGVGHRVFFGYVFSIRPNKNGEIDVTAYDQIRYLQNTDSCVYDNKKLSELVQIFCDQSGIKYGSTIVDTGYIIPNRVEDNQSYIDMINNANKLTTGNTGKEFVLWDDYGEIALVDRSFLKIDLLVNKDTAQDFSYESSIDGETFNQIKLVRENDDKTREVFVKSDPGTIGQWGLLQKTESLNKDENGDAKAQQILSQYNKKARTLSISGVFGDIRVRGGTILYVQLDTADLGESMFGYTISSWMQVESVTHNFEGGFHTMDLQMRGADTIV